MSDSAATRWNNHDITSDGRIVEECIRTPESDRRITWYDDRGRVARRESVAESRFRTARGKTA
jgi:hypothetical protein